MSLPSRSSIHVISCRAPRSKDVTKIQILSSAFKNCHQFQVANITTAFSVTKSFGSRATELNQCDIACQLFSEYFHYE